MVEVETTYQNGEEDSNYVSCFVKAAADAGWAAGVSRLSAVRAEPISKSIEQER